MSVSTTWVRFDYHEALWTEAARRASLQPVYEMSHRGEAGNQVGCLGEVIVEHWLQVNGIVFSDERHMTTHDYRLVNGMILDVKTKDRTVPPAWGYECSTPLYNHEHQRPDFYVFVSLTRDKHHPDEADILRYRNAYILGSITCARLDSEGKTWRAGEVDPSNGTKFWTDCKNVYIHQIDSPQKAIATFRSTAGVSGL